MATVNLTDDGVQVNTEKDNVAIRKVFATVPGGKALDVTGFAPLVINAGHPIIFETATKEYKPLPVNAGQTAYASLPTGHVYAGVLIASILTKKASAAILTQGVINPEACPYDFATVAAAVKTAMPLIGQQAD
ncbi:hypothetical protein [Pedobacter agri]|uniref:Head decoration protein n=1 Tax=Pedobacter agri TaxID=454586 RepID=A0A9X3IA49_9SPHI|nr:hypothetical protein [Pedobacter agri]MCX3266547.1 hypothetical protein [Pedobacter agri]